MQTELDVVTRSEAPLSSAKAVSTSSLSAVHLWYITDHQENFRQPHLSKAIAVRRALLVTEAKQRKIDLKLLMEPFSKASILDPELLTHVEREVRLARERWEEGAKLVHPADWWVLGRWMKNQLLPRPNSTA